MTATERDNLALELLTVCTPIVQVFARKLTHQQRRWLAVEDLQNVAVISILKCIDHGITDLPYVKAAVKYGLIKATAEGKNEETVSLQTKTHSDSESTLEETISSGEPSVEQEAQASQLKFRCIEVLNSLSEQERQIIQLHADGYSFPVIGGRFGISHDTAMRIWQRAVKKVNQ